MSPQCLERTWHTEGLAEAESVGMGFEGRDEGGDGALRESSSRQEPELDQEAGPGPGHSGPIHPDFMQHFLSRPHSGL